MKITGYMIRAYSLLTSHNVWRILMSLLLTLMIFSSMELLTYQRANIAFEKKYKTFTENYKDWSQLQMALKFTEFADEITREQTIILEQLWKEQKRVKELEEILKKNNIIGGR